MRKGGNRFISKQIEVTNITHSAFTAYAWQIKQTIITMKFTIFGATGPSGLELVQECLDNGHHVTALVRNPDKLQVKHDNLTVSTHDSSC